MIILGLVRSAIPGAADMCDEGDPPQTVAVPAVYDDGVLRVTTLSSPPGLAIAGEIDEGSYPALVKTLAQVAGHAEVHLNLAGVTYCDLAGLRAIIGLAEAGHGSRGRQVVLHDIPPRLRTVLDIVGWDATPGLVIDQGTRALRLVPPP
jgi:anti-anti-sigma factor